MPVDVKRALRTYVIGRDAGVAASLKAEMAERELERDGRSRSAAARGSRQPEAGGSDESRFGVPVPEKLDFHRSASRWRDFIPGLRRDGA